MNPEQYGWPLWAKAVVCLCIIFAGAIIGVFLHNLTSEVGNSDTTEVAKKQVPTKPTHREEIARLKEVKEKEEAAAERREATSVTGGGSNGTTKHPSAQTSSSVLAPGAEQDFTALESSLGASIGVAVAPFGSAPVETKGPLQSGHAWSSFKVPIVVAAMKRGPLTSEQKAQASAAITASDNAAAAALFSSLGSTAEASAAVEQVIGESGAFAEVTESPPPSGAVSTWGQTDWSLESSVIFYRALACDELLSESETDEVLGLMESVVPEQLWGLPSAGINGDVAIKAGWGPDGSASGPYLVRQAGILRSSDHVTGAVVTIAAQDSSGSFEAGVQDLEAVAGWVSENVRLNAGSC